MERRGSEGKEKGEVTKLLHLIFYRLLVLKILLERKKERKIYRFLILKILLERILSRPTPFDKNKIIFSRNIPPIIPCIVTGILCNRFNEPPLAPRNKTNTKPPHQSRFLTLDTI